MIPVVKEDMGTLKDMILNTVKSFPHKISYMFMDSFFSSVELAVELKKLNIDVTSIMRNNRKEIPEVLKKAKVKKGEIRVFQREEDKLVAARYHDKKDLTIITTFDSFHKVESKAENNKIKKSKYEVIDHYNHYSKGVDRLNQYCQYYR